MRRLILVVVVLILTVPSLFIFTKAKVDENAAISGSFMEDVRVVNKGPGKDKWILSAQKVDISADSMFSSLHNVTITLPGYDFDVTSDTGVFDIEGRNLTLAGNIVARGEGFSLKTESVELKAETSELSSDDKVLLEGNNFRVEGEGFHTNGEKRVTIEKNVKATFF